MLFYLKSNFKEISREISIKWPNDLLFNKKILWNFARSDEI